MSKRHSIPYEKIFTPQGLLGAVSKKPNLDFLMNICKIPRIYGVSGFGDWNVGQHTLACAFIALYWSKFQRYSESKRDRLVTLALLHDAHEAVVGDILPFFKTPEVRAAVNEIQDDILKSFKITEDEELKQDLKLCDMVSFLYEISQSTPGGIGKLKKKLLEEIYEKQKEEVIIYAQNSGFSKKTISLFLTSLHL